MYVAVRRLKHGTGYIEPGEPVPAESWPTKRALLSLGWIREVPNPDKDEAPDQPDQLTETSETETFNVSTNSYICSECGKEFASQHGLDIHHAKTHGYRRG